MTRIEGDSDREVTRIEGADPHERGGEGPCVRGRLSLSLPLPSILALWISAQAFRIMMPLRVDVEQRP